MANKWLMLWVIGLLVVSGLLPLWHNYGMDRTLVVDGNSDITLWAYDDRGLGGQSVSTLRHDGDALILDCRIVASSYAWPYCGFSATISRGTDGMDLSAFKTAAIDIRTTGPEPLPVKIYLRNFDQAISRPGDTGSLKVNSLQYAPEAGQQPFVIPLANFQVASWWIQAHHVGPHHSAPDLHNVTVWDVTTGDGVLPGHYTVRVNAIIFHGKWLSEVQLLSIILALWLASALLFLSGNIWKARRAVRSANLRRLELERLNTTLQLERQELEVAANHDDLTGTWNRIGLRNLLVDLVTQTRHEQRPLSIVFMDIDHFKSVNDHHGHETGDAVLKAFTDFVQARVREGDFLCRWGGEEFILLSGNTPLAIAAQTAERLRAQMGEQAWPHQASLSCSFGVAQIRTGEDTASLLKRADAAMYRAKRSGRNCVQTDPADARNESSVS